MLGTTQYTVVTYAIQTLGTKAGGHLKQLATCPFTIRIRTILARVLQRFANSPAGEHPQIHTFLVLGLYTKYT